jgi:energy-coupling factor transporter ATP-binding protein EcfA2
LKLANSPTLRALTHPLTHPTRGSRRPIPKTHPFLTLTGCHANNLKNIDVSIPLGRLTVLTGISGSGKSTLMHECVAAVFNKQAKQRKTYQKSTGGKSIKACYEVDQSPIGKTSRSCPATYVMSLLGDVGVGEEAGGELGFFLLELVDALFDGVLAEEFVDEDRFVLADAVGAVGGLGFGGGVPPGVVVDDGVGGG